MADYGRTSGTGGPGSKAYRNDDAQTMTNLPDDGTKDYEDKSVKKAIKDERLIF